MKKSLKIIFSLSTFALLLSGCSSKEPTVTLLQVENSSVPIEINLNDLISDINFVDNSDGDKFTLHIKNNANKRISNLKLVVQNDKTTERVEYINSSLRPETSATMNSHAQLSNKFIKGETTLSIPEFQYRIIDEDNTGYIYTQVKYSKENGYDIKEVNNSALGKAASEKLQTDNKANQEELSKLKDLWGHIPESQDKNAALEGFKTNGRNRVHEIVAGEIADFNASFVGNNVKVTVDVMPLFKLTSLKLEDIINSLADIATNDGLLKTTTDYNLTLNKITIEVKQTPENVHIYSFTLGEGWTKE